MFRFPLKSPLRVVAVLAGLLVLLITAKPAQAQNNGLRTNQSLHPGQYLLSQNGRYQFIFQYDGNVVLYDLWNRHRALWASNTVNRHGFLASYSDNLVMQADGNLVLYGYYFNPYIGDIWHNPAYQNRRSAFWASNTADYYWVKYHADPILVVQNDGNVVIYVYPLTPDAFAIWATNTNYY